MRKKCERLALWLIAIILSVAIIAIRISAAEYKWHQVHLAPEHQSSLDLPKQ